jgi:hypothetical protein
MDTWVWSSPALRRSAVTVSAAPEAPPWRCAACAAPLPAGAGAGDVVPQRGDPARAALALRRALALLHAGLLRRRRRRLRLRGAAAGDEDGGGGQRDQAAGQLKVTEALLPPVQVVVEAPTHDMV